jgi:hypothetical protein
MGISRNLPVVCDIKPAYKTLRGIAAGQNVAEKKP